MGMQQLKKEIETKGIVSFVPSGHSMWPLFKNRKQAVIIQKKSGRLSKYDTAFYENKKDGLFVLHRVIEVYEDGYLFTGDSTLETDRVKEEDVFGVLIGFYKGKKYIDSKNEKYKKKVEKWYKNEKRRKRKVRLYLRSVSLFERIKKKFTRKNSNV
ncbi:MAG: hypothetical protein MJ066_00020 [Clostridia bacterium]|nr:hypothetical protein [Clostridia bacterium]